MIAKIIHFKVSLLEVHRTRQVGIHPFTDSVLIVQFKVQVYFGDVVAMIVW